MFLINLISLPVRLEKVFRVRTDQLHSARANRGSNPCAARFLSEKGRFYDVSAFGAGLGRMSNVTGAVSMKGLGCQFDFRRRCFLT
jgi:hypothetical protein